MGMVFEKIRVETTKFEVLQSTKDYAIRKYIPSVVAEITYDPSQFKGDKDGDFLILDKYIGAFGNPQNTKLSKPETIAMTSPAFTKLSSKPIAMTSLMLTKEGEEGKLVTMQFILPEKYKKAEDAPRSVDERVVIREFGEMKYGVEVFSGVGTEKVVAEKVEKLKAALERDGFKVVRDLVLWRYYNPSWITLPMFRTNEVLLPIEYFICYWGL